MYGQIRASEGGGPVESASGRVELTMMAVRRVRRVDIRAQVYSHGVRAKISAASSHSFVALTLLGEADLLTD